MANINNLQKAVIIEAKDDYVRVKHPDISGNLRTYLTASIAAAGVTATVKDNSGWLDNQWFILGYPGVAQTEEDDVNQASVTRGTSITITNTLAFAHEVDCPMTRISERKIRIKGATTLTGTQTEVTGSPFTIAWDKSYTDCKPTSTQYAFYFAEFSDGAGSPVYGDQSDGVARTGLAANTVEEICQNALNLTGEKMSSDSDGLISRKFLLREFNNWQDDVTARRDWSWEIVDEQTITSSENVNKHAMSGLTYTLKHPNSDKSVIAMRFNGKRLDPMKWGDYLESQEGVAYTTLASNVLAAAVTCTLTDSYDFAESGTILIGSDTATYTANAQSTGILSGIAATEFASAHTSGDPVWQDVSPSEPRKFCVYNDNIYFNVPVATAYAGIKFRISYYKELSRMAEMSDTTDIPFTYLAQYFLASRIETAKGNFDRANNFLALYEGKMALEVRKDRQPLDFKFTPQGDDTSSMSGQGHFYRSTESSKYNWD